jgi:hypothetical protein
VKEAWKKMEKRKENKCSEGAHTTTAKKRNKRQTKTT